MKSCWKLETDRFLGNDRKNYLFITIPQKSHVNRKNDLRIVPFGEQAISSSVFMIW